MKIGIFTGGTSVRSKNIFTDISRYPTGKHEINSVLYDAVCSVVVLTGQRLYSLTIVKHVLCLFLHDFVYLNLFPNKPWFLRVCSTNLLKRLWEKEKLLVMSNFSFSNSVFYPFGELSVIFIQFEMVVCNLFQFGRV